MLRYDSEEKRATNTGAFISIIVMVLLVVAFYSSWLDVLDKKEVRSEDSVIREMDPSSAKITDQNFILAMTFNGINLANTTERYFDFVFTQKYKRYGESTITKYINLIPCPRERFSQFGAQYAEFYDQLNLGNALCFP